MTYTCRSLLKISLTPSITSARSVALEIKQFALPNLTVYTFPMFASPATFLGIISRAAVIWGIFLSLEDDPPCSIKRRSHVCTEGESGHKLFDLTSIPNHAPAPESYWGCATEGVI